MATRRAILEAAAATFAAEGYAGATLAKVGERLGITKSAVLYHFSSKDQLLDEVLTPVSDAHRDLVRSFAEPPGTLAGRLEVLRSLMRLYALHSTVCVAIQNDQLLWRQGSVARAMGENYDALVRLLCGPGSADDAEARAHAALLVSFRAGTVGLDMTGGVHDAAGVETTLRLCADILRS